MKNLKMYLGILLFVLFRFFGSAFAVELNSTNIIGAPFNCSTGATDCNLTNKSITSIASGTFINHTNLQYLYLYSNQITSIESGDFNGLTNLQYLYLYTNQITSIESGDFNGLTNLQYLSLYSNQITSIESGDFDGLTNLQSLYLSYNQITSIESGDFNGLTNLEDLYLYSNQITSIESSGFNGLINLENLELSYNQITSIESGDFDGLTSLQSLLLKSNQISSIEFGDFDGLTSLKYIDLSSNQISSIESGDFNGLSNLEDLELSYNQITSIESGDFDSLTNLVNLYLSSNCINNQDTNVTNYLNTLPGTADYSDQYVCMQVNYDPSTTTSGIVTGRLVFIGPTSYVVALESENPDMSVYDHVYISNGSHTYNYISILDTNVLLWTRNFGKPNTVEGNVTWIDTIAPVITINGSNPVDIYIGDTYLDAGAIWTDNLDGSGTIATATSGTVNTNVLGTYYLEYEKIDTAGNITMVTRTVNVVNRTSSGGRGSALKKDNCSDGDYSDSYYDGECGIHLANELEDVQEKSEQEIVYQWALLEGITNIFPMENAQLEAPIIRAELAKMISVYAEKVLKKTYILDDDKCYNYSDIGSVSDELKGHIFNVCRLGIMGLYPDGKTPMNEFYPYDYVTRGQFGTILSRMLYGDKYNSSNGELYRIDHLDVLKDNGILKFTDPSIGELRGRILLMLYRSK